MSANKYRPEIDGLRAVAVLAVILYHAFPNRLPGGFVGVDIFFVISGFLITSIIAREIHSERFSFWDFYARRARRIFPALSIVLAAVLVAGSFLLLATEYKEVGKHVAGGAFFVSNLISLTEAGYFDISAAYKPLLHLWSLGVEEQFYLVWPTTLILGTVFRFRLWLVASTIALASFVCCFILTPQNLHAAFYLPQARFWELMAGAVLALASPAIGGRSGPLLRVVGTAFGLGLIIAGIAIAREDAFFPAPMAAMLVVGAVMVILAGANSLSLPLLGNPVARWIGLVSYPLYLWHWPLLSFPTIILNGVAPTWVRIAAVCAAFLLAAATYYLVERPLRHGHRLTLKAVLCTTLLAVTGLIGLWIYSSEGLKWRLPVEASQGEFVGPLWSYTQNQNCLDRFPMEGASSYGWWFCSVSSPRPPTILLLGTSFANALYPGMALNPDLKDETALSFGACDPAWADEAAPDADQFSPCTPSRRFEQQQVVDQIIYKYKPKLIILNGLNRDPDEDYIERTKRRIASMIDRGSQVVIYLPHYRAEKLLRGCFARPLLDPIDSCTFDVGAIDAIRSGFQPLVDRISSAYPQVGFFDPNVLYCTAGQSKCSLIVNGRPVFRDEYDHFSEYASIKLGEYFMDWLPGWGHNPL